jgi:capsular polysaccharide biosynthesis protein
VRRLDNEDEIVQALQKRAGNEGGGLVLLNGQFSSMSLRQQVQAAQAACVMVGAHGAGLSHILFSPPGVHMLELQPPAFQRPHFIAYSTWAGATHHLWALSNSQPGVGEVLSMIDQTVQAAVVQQRDDHERREGHGSAER